MDIQKGSLPCCLVSRSLGEGLGSFFNILLMLYALVHYHEIALKGRNRGFFEQRLVHHLRSSLKDLSHIQVEALPGRIRVTFPEEHSVETIRGKLSRTFGIVNFSFARSVPVDQFSPDLTRLKEAIGRELPSLPFQTFRVTTKRAEKRFSKTSVDVDREVGAFICEQTGKRVNLSHPDLTIFIEILEKEFYYSFKKRTWSWRTSQRGREGRSFVCFLEELIHQLRLIE